MGDCAAYIICTSPRSGSTLLCRMLEAIGRCGVPDSHFHEPSVGAWLSDHGVPNDAHDTHLSALEAAIAAARIAGTGGKGMFGLRLQRHSLAYFLDQLHLLMPCHKNDLSRIDEIFGSTKFIHLSRTSKLDQAISYLKAEQSGLWHRSPDGSEIERLSAPRPFEYKRNAIAARIAAFEEDEREWAAWFTRERIAPLRIEYEALARDPRAVLREVLTYLGLSSDLAEGVGVPVARLSDGINRAWADRYRAESHASAGR
jgi:LPS sulfotransferase NodH